MTTSSEPSATAGPTTSTAKATPATPPVAEVERPPPGLAQGRYAAPPWLIGAVAAALLVAVVAYFVVRHRRAKRQRGYESIAPHSTPHSSRR